MDKGSYPGLSGSNPTGCFNKIYMMYRKAGLLTFGRVIEDKDCCQIKSSPMRNLLPATMLPIVPRLVYFFDSSRPLTVGCAQVFCTNDFASLAEDEQPGVAQQLSELTFVSIQTKVPVTLAQVLCAVSQGSLLPGTNTATQQICIPGQVSHPYSRVRVAPNDRTCFVRVINI